MSSSRTEGGWIPIGEIVAYGQLLDVKNLLEFVNTVKLIDSTYMRIARQKEQANGR